jgi:AbrB family looped-hinge helix DNA binding protein
MSKVTSKLQVTIPKTIADQFNIKPGDAIEWDPAADAIRVIPPRSAARALDVAGRLKLFDAATERQRARNATRKRHRTTDRGWRREDLYTRGRAR